MTKTFEKIEHASDGPDYRDATEQCPLCDGSGMVTPGEADSYNAQWIPVSERLPEGTEHVLGYWRPIDYVERPYHREIAVFARSFSGDDFWWSPGAGRYYSEDFITHWMPLPEPPNE